MIAKFGAADSKFVRMQPAETEPGDMPGPDTEVEIYTGPVVVLPNNSELRKVFDALTNGPTVQIGEVQAYVSPSDGSIKFGVGDELRIGKITYGVKNGIVYDPDGQGALLHILEVQKLKEAA